MVEQVDFQGIQVQKKRILESSFKSLIITKTSFKDLPIQPFKTNDINKTIVKQTRT